MSETWQIVVVALAAGFVLEGLLLVAVMRQMGELVLYGHSGRRQANTSAGPKLGTVVELPGRERNGIPVLVIFTASECEQCRSLEPGLQWIHAFYGPDAPYRHQLDLVAVLTDGNPNSRAEHARELGSFARTDLIALMQDWDVPGTPFAVALDAAHRVKGATVVNTRRQLESLAVERLDLLFLAPEHRGEGADSLEIQHVGRMAPAQWRWFHDSNCRHTRDARSRRSIHVALARRADHATISGDPPRQVWRRTFDGRRRSGTARPRKGVGHHKDGFLLRRLPLHDRWHMLLLLPRLEVVRLRGRLPVRHLPLRRVVV